MEIKNHFNEDFQLIIPGELNALSRLNGQSNFWKEHELVNTIKGKEARRKSINVLMRV